MRPTISTRIRDRSDDEIITPCRGCGQDRLEVVLSLGDMPLANGLLTSQRLDEAEPRYPLDVAFCEECALVQLTVSVPPEVLFSDYAYLSSYSDTVVQNAGKLVRRMIHERTLGSASLAVEIASNDGYLLQHYVRAGVPVLGIDPAANIAPVAEARGVRTLARFFGSGLAEDLRAAGARANVLHANNVLAHVPDLNGFVRGIARVLADDGIAVIETPYVGDLIERLEFDTIYHEHVFYYSLTSLDRVFRRNGLQIVHVEHLPIHGGSLRLFVAHEAGAIPGAAVRNLLAWEEKTQLTSVSFYLGFADRVRTLCESLRDLLLGLKSEGKRLAAYGAAAKGAVLLNSLSLPSETLEFVADRSPRKQGRYMPGVHLPVMPTQLLLETMPDHLLLLAWNVSEEIMEQQADYRRRGGRFIIPLPVLRIV